MLLGLSSLEMNLAELMVTVPWMLSSPNVVLRLWFMDFIHHYPIDDPMIRLHDHKKIHPDKPLNYEGDLEATLKKKENPALNI